MKLVATVSGNHLASPRVRVFARSLRSSDQYRVANTGHRIFPCRIPAIPDCSLDLRDAHFVQFLECIRINLKPEIHVLQGILTYQSQQVDDILFLEL